MIMCNQEKRCEKMRNAVLRVLTEKLKSEREKEAYSNCKNIIAEIKEEISEYDCEPFVMIKKKIKNYQKCEHYAKRTRMIDVLIAALEAFLLED